MSNGEKSRKRIVLTGGGTAGHVTPNLALMPRLKDLGYQIVYIGSYDGIEREIISKTGTKYLGIATGKLRRYFDLKNFTDPFKVLKGYGEAKKYLKKIRPDVVFSKGGFVAVPVVLAAKSLKIPVIIHESDMTPGLANKICFPAARKVCCNFPETMDYLPPDKAVLSGSPIRQELFNGSREQGLSFCGFSEDKPVLLIIGGSLGSVAVNQAVRSALGQLLQDYQIIHLCGKGNLDPSLDGLTGYAQFEFISEELPDLMAAADLVISRAGANSICELLALQKPNILIPLPASSSRGDQLLNAESFRKQGFSRVLPEEEVTDDTLLEAVKETYEQRDNYIQCMEWAGQRDAITTIIRLIEESSAVS